MELACNDDAGGTYQSEITLGLAAAEEVWVRVSGFGGSTGSYDLHVLQSYGISGTITREDTGDPISGATVMLFDQSGYFEDQVTTGASGGYSFGGLLDGTYFVQASADGVIDELYDDVSCPSYFYCYPEYDGTPIEVSGASVTGIDLALTSSGTISGTVTAASGGDPVEAYMGLYSVFGTFIDSLYAGGDGTYEISGIPSGKYYLVAEAYDYQDELYDDIPCPGSCDVTTGTQLQVTNGATLSGIDFALNRFGAITGSLTKQGTGDPIANERVVVYDEAGTYSGSDYTDSGGSYRVGSRAPGAYFVRTDTDEHRDELFDDVPCPGSCDPTTGTGVDVVLNGTASGIDFVLDRLGEIGGTLTEEGTGNPISGESVDAYDSSGNHVRSAYTMSDGSYRLTRLEAGTHFVRTDTYSHRDEVYDDVSCGSPCDVTTGTPVTTALNSSVTGIDFSLPRLGSIRGTVTHSVSGDPIGNLRLEVFTDTGSYVRSDDTSSDGSYTVERLRPGGYTVITDSRLYRNKVYDDVPCSGTCNLTTGTPVNVTLATTTSGIDFGLDRLGVIEGQVTATDTAEGLIRNVAVFDENGDQVASDYASSGSFTINGLQPGTYYVKTFHNDYYGPVYQDELWNDVPCEPSCSFSGGAGLPIVLNGRIVGVDFALTPCPANSYTDVTGTLYLSTHLEEACERLTAGAGTTVSSGADVTFKAGRSVALGDGFSVESGANFRVVIEPAWVDD
jgi:hypothetical protein